MADSMCESITSISDLLDWADRDLINITSTISLCPDVCSLVWGKGNPDLSGIGVNVSYIMQAILTILCGPIFGLIYGLRHKGLSEANQVRLTQTTKSFIDISVGFNIPVAIAAANRISQYASFFETFFLQYLLSMQFISFTTAAFTVLTFDKRHRRSTRTIFLYFALQYLLVIIAAGLQSKNVSRLEAGKELIDGCNKYSLAFPFVIQAMEQTLKWRNAQWVIWVMVPMWAIVLFFSFLYLFKTPRRHIQAKFKGNLPSIQRGRPIKIVFQLFLVALLLYATSMMEIMRDKLRAIIGNDYQDNQWGFGQIMAVCLWLLLCVQLLYFLMSVAWYASDMSSDPEGFGKVIGRLVYELGDDEDEPINNDQQLTMG